MIYDSLVLLTYNRVGQLGVGFGQTFAFGIGLCLLAFLFYSLRDRPGLLAGIVVVGAIAAYIVFGETFREIFAELRWE